MDGGREGGREEVLVCKEMVICIISHSLLSDIDRLNFDATNYEMVKFY